MQARYVRSGATVLENCEPTDVSVGTELLGHLIEQRMPLNTEPLLHSFLNLLSKSVYIEKYLNHRWNSDNCHPVLWKVSTQSEKQVWAP